MSHRIERINHLIRQEISEMLRREVKDPRLGNFVAITDVSVTPDLKYSKVFISFIGSQEERQRTLEALARAAGYFRSELAKRLDLRRIPELTFLWDDSIERAEHLMQLIERVESEENK